MKYLLNLLVLTLMFQMASSVALAQATKPSDLIISPGSRSALKEAFGENWEELVNSDPERFSTGANRGFLPADWKSFVNNTPSKASVTSAKLPSDFIVGEQYQASFAKAWGDDWKEKINRDPDSFAAYLPDNWKSIIADNPICTYIYKGKCIFPDKADKPSDFIRDTNVHESLEKVHGKDWRNIVDSDPEKFPGHLPKDWKDRISSNTEGSNSETDKVSASNNSEVNNEHGKSNQKDDAGKASIANQILAIGTGIIGSNILIDCKLGALTPSMYTFMAGSLVYIGSEITGAKAQQAFIKVKKEEVEQLKKTMTEGGDLQKGIIEVKLKEEEDKLAFVKKRKTWTTAVAAMYGAATGLAAMEQACVSNPATLPVCKQWLMAQCGGGTSLPSSKALSAGVLGAYGFAVGNAGGTAVSRYGTAVAAGLGVVVPSLTAKVSVAYQTPMSRIVTFGAGTALTAAVMMELNKVQKDLESNIGDLKKLLADFKSKTDSGGGIDEGGEAGAGAAGGWTLPSGSGSGSGNINRLGSGTSVEKSCWGTNASGVQTYSPDVCAKALQLSRPKYDSKFSLPTLQRVANTGVDMAQAVARGDMARADIAAGELAENAMRVNQITDNLMKQLNDQNKKLGKDAINLDGEVQKTLDGMNKQLSNGLNSRGVELASLGSGGFNAGLDKQDPSLLETDTRKDSSVTALDALGGSGMGFDVTRGMSEEAFDPNSSNVSKTQEVAAHTIDDFETNEADILDRPETSIFRQVSNRYLLNYKRFFNTEPPKAPQK